GIGVSNKNMIEVGQELKEVSRQLVRPDLGDEAGRFAAALAPIGDRRKRIQFIAVGEHWEKEIVVLLEDPPAPPIICKAAGKRGQTRCKARELVSPPREFEC